MGEHRPGGGSAFGAGGPALRYAVIAAGGAGSRLWPWSRLDSPKHLLDLTGAGRTLLQQTHDRLTPLVERVFILTEERQVPLIRAQLPDAEFIIEPTARGTANALGLAAFAIAEREPDAVMVCVPADHQVEGDAEFRDCVGRAIAAAQPGEELVTIGLTPTQAATGFGYIEVGERRGDLFDVVRFVEKPSEEVARGYLASGRHYWNLAMFCWRAATFIEELRELAPVLHDGLVAFREGRGDYAALPNEAVDYAVMEKTGRLLLVPATFGWRDVGSWSEVLEMRSRDGSGNSVDGDAALLETTGSLISAPGKLVAAIGVEDLIVIDTDDVLLILPKTRAQDVKRIVELLRASGRTRYL